MQRKYFTQCITSFRKLVLQVALKKSKQIPDVSTRVAKCDFQLQKQCAFDQLLANKSCVGLYHAAALVGFPEIGL